ncbi:MAG TPA: GNAT family N-acetyltransferase [Pilimelia sp.]|nr:GNAT family N-acetyltransferase [Pilimelia sp.]
MTGFETARLTVREWTDRPADLDRLFDMYSRWEVTRWLGHLRALGAPAQAAELLRSWRVRNAAGPPPLGIWAVRLRSTGVVVGTVLLKHLVPSDGSPARAGGPAPVEVGWHLHPDSWGRGYATEAARGAVRRAFAAGLPEVYAVVHPANTTSLAVARRLGMVPLGRTDEWYNQHLASFVSRP